jgi:hypothetical protein
MPGEVQSCQIRDTLKFRVRADLKVYKEAVIALQEQTGPDFREAHKKAERARLAYEVARGKLDAHKASHGCA